jgi:GT2 family glycosyltransferase
LNLIIIDDASTDLELSNYIRKWTITQNATLIRNKKNIGYIKSVNSVIKNIKSDSATIFSFPSQNTDNQIEYQISELQLAAEINTNIGNFEAPTLNGFCMAIKKIAWDQIGQFDEEKFYLGYGEECDWSMRAKLLNWTINLAPDVFVKHAHGGSFEPDIKETLLENSSEQIRKDWPNYFNDVEKHISTDPWAFLRARIQLKLLLGDNWIIIFTTNLPGGARRWFLKTAKEEIENGNQVLQIYQNEYGQIIGKPFKELDKNSSHNNIFEFQNWKELRTFQAENSKLNKVIFSSLVGYKDPIEVITEFGSLSGNYSILPSHDYFSLCPSHNLLNDKNRYCGLPTDIQICNKCLPKNLNVISTYRNRNVMEWRKSWDLNVDLIEYYSKASQRIFAKSMLTKKMFVTKKHIYFSDFQKETAIKLLAKKQRIIHEKMISNQRIHIAFVGDFAFHKGSDVFASLAELSYKMRKNWDFYIFGTAHDRVPNRIQHFLYSGEAQLFELLEFHKIDICVVPANWPETYNYVTDELISGGFTLIVSPLGAMAERLIIDETPFGQTAQDITPIAYLSALEAQLDRVLNEF